MKQAASILKGLENCKGVGSRKFFRIKNKEQGRAKWEINKEQEVSIEPRAGVAFGNWLTGYS